MNLLTKSDHISSSNSWANKVVNFVLKWFLVFFLVGDFINKIVFYYRLEFTPRFGGTTKGLFEILLIFLIIRTGKKSTGLFFICALVGTFLIGNLISHFTLADLDWMSQGYFLNRYLVMFLCYTAFMHLPNREEVVSFVIKVFVIFGIINTLASLLGLAFDIGLFQTYYGSSRFGYDGFIARRGEASYIYIFLISYFFYKSNQQLSKRNIIGLLFFILGGLILGTKAVFFFLFTLAILGIFLIKASKYRRIGLGVVLLIASVLIVLKERIITFFLNSFPFWQPIYDEYGLQTILFSKRDLLFQELLQFLTEKGSLLNSIFGGMNFEMLRVELEIIDVWIFFGIIGLLVYGLFTSKHLIRNWKDKAHLIILASIVLTASLAGNLFHRITCSILLVILSFEFSSSFERKKTRHED